MDADTYNLPIKQHVRLAERHAQRAYELSFRNDQKQSFFVRVALGRAQSILISLLANNKLR